MAELSGTHTQKEKEKFLRITARHSIKHTNSKWRSSELAVKTNLNFYTHKKKGKRGEKKNLQ